MDTGADFLLFIATQYCFCQKKKKKLPWKNVKKVKIQQV